MKKIKLIIISLVALIGVATLVPNYAFAAPADEIQKGVNASGGTGQATLGSRIQTLVNVLLFIVIGGIRYATSNGDSGSIKTAKDTILYAVIGLIAAIMAYAIVNFVVSAFTK
jgi:uncharacterized membrane protein